MMFAQPFILLGLGLLPSAYGHMIMANPEPFGHPDNSPLRSDGSDFPCKVGAGGQYQVTKMNDWQVGSQQTLSFNGSAVHAGGSCQISVTTDKQPTKDSKFKVIYSIEGGCPGVDKPATFPFSIPKELPNGEGTMAWTWMNKIGNREFYMNCAPIKVSGGSDDAAAFNALPDMAVANLATTSCKNEPSFDYIFENPGKYTTRIGAGPFAPLCGGPPVSGSPGASPTAPGNGTPPSKPTTFNNGLWTPPGTKVVGPSTIDSSVAPTSPVASQVVPVTSTVHTLVTVTVPAGTGSIGQPSVAPSNTTSIFNRPSEPTASSAPAAQPSNAPTPAPGNTTCGDQGTILCNGSDKFGICNHGRVVWQPVAPGTKCQDGAIAKVKRDYVLRTERANKLRGMILHA